MGALRKAQFEYDNRQAPPVVDARDSARQAWLEEAGEQLARGSDIKVQRRLRAPRIVTFAEFKTHIQLLLLKRWEDGEDKGDWLAEIVIQAAFGEPCRTTAASLLGDNKPDQHLIDLAAEFLEPLADDALIAQAEGAEL
ncbi:hypothetical protein HFV04_021620 [Pseudomonas sp. BIGb0427]|uniref:hypothetical protein n=1 Tax=Pseudomonas sp. BIGb0427 TaxID=2724470 RepID=UPI0016954A81|nr:hypothetical protein [Pseudomonas sp. BIGb0427]NLU60448.1 hypothetical protein [Pseudomonas sp. BIGb0427]QPG62102.1 hypothetical protein HFV04_021620 [Pseudomonas sp. BIGb0427]